jgi:hypothetical protein
MYISEELEYFLKYTKHSFRFEFIFRVSPRSVTSSEKAEMLKESSASAPFPQELSGVPLPYSSGPSSL